MRELLITVARAFILTPILLLSVSIGGAQVMESGSYRIQSDSVNFGGGRATSTSYSLESTTGESGTGESSSASYELGAGYQQMQESYISLSGFAAVAMSPSIPGISGGFSNGSTTVLVVTDSMSGYLLQVASSQSPAMQTGSDTIADYVPQGSDPDYNFVTNAADAHFGYSPEGVDIVTRFMDDGAACNTGVGDTVLVCWDGLSTTDQTVARRTSANNPTGSTTTLNFRVGVGDSALQPPGLYTATTTLTALTL